MDKGDKDLLLKAGIAGGVLVIVGVAASQFVKGVTGPSGGSCSDPSSPCGAAVAPYAQEFQSCLNQYTQYMNQFVTEDAKASPPTGLTTAQLSVLNQLESCMHTAAVGMGNAAKNFGQSPLGTIADYAAPAFAAAIVAVGIGITYKLVSPNTAATIAASVRSAIIQARAAAGDITSSFATALDGQLSSIADTATASDAAQLSDYFAQGLIVLQDEASLAAADENAIADNLAELASVLSDLGALGYSPLSYGPEFDVPTTDYDPDRFQGSPAFSWGPVTDVPTTAYDPDAFGYGPGGPGMVFATPAVDDCGCHGGLRFGRGNMWMLRKKG